MKAIKKMLLGIAFLIIGCAGVPFWVSGAALGAVMFIAGLVVGLVLCVDGFLTPEGSE